MDLEILGMLLSATPCRFVFLKMISSIISLFTYGVATLLWVLSTLSWCVHVEESCFCATGSRSSSDQIDLFHPRQSGSWWLFNGFYVHRLWIQCIIPCNISRDWCHCFGHNWCFNLHLCRSPPSSFGKVTCWTWMSIGDEDYMENLSRILMYFWFSSVLSLLCEGCILLLELI
jgi:hypothetical protein